LVLADTYEDPAVSSEHSGRDTAVVVEMVVPQVQVQVLVLEACQAVFVVAWEADAVEVSCFYEVLQRFVL
jgi:hypothetical protein